MITVLILGGSIFVWVVLAELVGGSETSQGDMWLRDAWVVWWREVDVTAQGAEEMLVLIKHWSPGRPSCQVNTSN